MSLPNAYLTSFKNLKNILEAIQAGQAPKRFTISFLESLDFKATSDRLIIGVLKAVGFLNPNGEPTQRYYDYLDQTRAKRVLADGIREAYADLFQINTKANELSNVEIKNKLKTLTQGQASDAVLEKMAGTFKALCALADFSQPPKVSSVTPATQADSGQKAPPEKSEREEFTGPVRLGGLVYNIQIQLPESRDPAVYDALFRSLKEHLLR